MKKHIRTIDKIVRGILGWIGAIFEIPRLIVQYTLGLIWTAYSMIRGKDFKKVFARLNEGAAKEVKWIVDEFRFNTF